MVTRTTISLDEDLHQRVASLLKGAHKRLNPLVNDLLKGWVAEQERERYREDIGRRFREAFATGADHHTAQLLEREWAEVDEESARELDNLQ